MQLAANLELAASVAGDAGER